MDFLPSDYKSPSSNSDNYFKAKKDTENRIRIMSKPVLGWEDWNKENRPIRFRMDAKPAQPVDANKPVRHFWAFVIYNYNEDKIQVMHVVQASIQKAIQALVTNDDWGSPYTYDIKIKREGEGKETSYNVIPCPHKPIDSAIIAEFHEKQCNLEALFTNEDPFAPYQTRYTECECTGVKNDSNALHIDASQAQTLQKILAVDDEIEKAIMDLLIKQGIKTLMDIPKAMYDKVVKRAVSIREEWEKKEKAAIDLPF